MAVVKDQAEWRPSTAAEALSYLTPDLVDFLADLDGAPPSIAHGAVQLLPFGSRAALLATGLATVRCAGDRPTAVGLGLTPLGFAVIAEAAAASKHDEIRRLAEAASAIVAAHAADAARR